MNEFPSPCGDYGSYLFAGTWVEEYKDEISVPLRGLWFLSQALRRRLIALRLKFPSPCGDYGSYLN